LKKKCNLLIIFIHYVNFYDHFNLKESQTQCGVSDVVTVKGNIFKQK